MKKEYLNEIWRPIKGYEGLYEVSNLGRVRSLDRWCSHRRGKQLKKGKILLGGKDYDGYRLVLLYKEGKRKTFKVHRLVAEAFIPNPNNLPQVNHKDENKLNNSVDNLEWCDAKYNSNYGTHLEKISKKVLQYDLEGNFIKEWQSTRECERNGFSHTGISSCCRGKLKYYKGFIWRYK